MKASLLKCCSKDPVPTPGKHDFTTCMEEYLELFIQQPSETKTVVENVKVAVIDTGFYVDDDDPFLLAVEHRVKDSKCFVGSSNDCTDHHGHGTQVARLLLNYAPEADIYIAKISDSGTFEETRLDQLVEVSVAPFQNISTGVDSTRRCNGLGREQISSTCHLA